MEEMVKNTYSSPFYGFKGKRILITGDTGFKGAWLALWLHQLDAEVFGYALPPEHEQGLFRLAGLEQIIRHCDGDIRDYGRLAQTMTDFQPEIVLHLAAQALVRKSYLTPKETFDVNVGGTVNVLEAIRSTPSVKSVVLITSDKCYRNKEWVWGYRENDELGGHDPYSASKAAAEIAISAYLDSFFRHNSAIGVASARAGNVIGGGDRALDRIIPDCIAALEENRPIIIRKPKATRPWQHVLEPLSGYLLLAARLLEDTGHYTGAWNFGPDTSSVRTVHELAQQIVGHWGSGEVRVVQETGAPHEANLLQLNTDKARIELGWQPKWSVNQTVAETVSWYRHVHDGHEARTLTLSQIKKYME